MAGSSVPSVTQFSISLLTQATMFLPWTKQPTFEPAKRRDITLILGNTRALNPLGEPCLGRY